ncbi:MAG: Fur family transcriptional regulator, partial [Planctomycetota bacterium]
RPLCGKTVVDARQKFEQFVATKGLRRTGQRAKVVDVFLGTERHVTVQELHDLVRRRHKGIGYATVARTVKLMCESDLCRQVDFGDGAVRYEHKYDHEHHDHLICLNCGKFEEIYSPKLEQLQHELVEKHDYVQHSHKLDIFGLCPECANADAQKTT